MLAGVLDYLAAGRVDPWHLLNSFETLGLRSKDLAMQCIFSVGNEQTLRAVLGRGEFSGISHGESWNVWDIY